MIIKTINAAKKGRKFGKGYITSLGSFLHTRTRKHIHIKERKYIPSFIKMEYIDYIAIANKYPENKIYNNFEVIIPIYDAPISWINIESNFINLKAFSFSRYEDIDISKYKKVKFPNDQDLKDKIAKLGIHLKDNMKYTYKKGNHFILKGAEVNIFVGTAREYLDFKGDLDTLKKGDRRG